MDGIEADDAISGEAEAGGKGFGSVGGRAFGEEGIGEIIFDRLGFWVVPLAGIGIELGGRFRGSVGGTIRERLGGGGAEIGGGASEAWRSGRWWGGGRILGDGSNAHQRKEGATGEKMTSTFFHLK